MLINYYKKCKPICILVVAKNWFYFIYILDVPRGFIHIFQGKKNHTLMYKQSLY